MKPAQFRDTLVAKYVPRIGPKMGSGYRNVVQLCLDGIFGGEAPSKAFQKRLTPEEERNTFGMFEDRVVYPRRELARASM